MKRGSVSCDAHDSLLVWNFHCVLRTLAGTLVHTTVRTAVVVQRYHISESLHTAPQTCPFRTASPTRLNSRYKRKYTVTLILSDCCRCILAKAL